jgi:PAS domain-containing protein
MKSVCAWCGDELGKAEREDAGAGPVTHGICAACRRSFFGRSLGELDLFLDTLDLPVLVVDGDAAVSYANRAARKALGKDLPAVRGFRNGDVFECVNARLPGGCGQTDRCRGCLIRRAVEETWVTGEGREGLPTLITRLKRGRKETMRAVISTERLGNAVLLRIDALDPAE